MHNFWTLVKILLSAAAAVLIVHRQLGHADFQLQLKHSSCHIILKWPDPTAYLPMCFAILQWTQVHKLIFCSSEFASVLLATTYLPILPMCELAICNVIFLQQSVFAICCCARHLQQTCCCLHPSLPSIFFSFSHLCLVFSSQHHISIKFKLINKKASIFIWLKG